MGEDQCAAGRFGSQAEVGRFFERHPVFPRNKKGDVTRQRVADILTHPLYTGHICSERYGIHWLKGHHEALISVETFEKVQSLRKGVAKAPQRKNIGEDFVLRGMVTCAECDTPLRSSWSTGKMKRYPYYICQTKGCDAYGKPIPRDKIEGEVGAILKSLEPTPGLLSLARAMFRRAWDQRLATAQEAVQSAKAQLKGIEKQIDALLGRLVETINPSVISAYEGKIADLEKDRARLTDMAGHHTAPEGTFDEKLEHLFQFLANPWKIWENGTTPLRRTVLRLAFTRPLSYHRNEGARTPEISLPFKALRGIQGGDVCYGAGGGT